jgi:hypothetical protein
MVISGVVYEHDAHYTVQIIFALIVDGNASFVFEILADSSLKQVDIERREEKCVQGRRTLLHGIQVKIVTHLI